MRPGTAGDHYTRATLLLLGVWTLIRLWFCTTLDLVGDEAYYWLWAQHLDLCYYSKGPGIAWAMAASTALLGDTVFGLRVLSVLAAAGTSWFTFLLARDTFSSRVGFWAVLVATLTPVFLIGSVLITIDPLSVFFWMATALVFWRAAQEERAGPWALAGALVALGMLVKFTNVALLISFLIACVWIPSWRRHLGRPRFFLLIAMALLAFVPVLVWNAQHDWITFQHLKERGSLDRPWRVSPKEFSQFLGGQFGVYFPLFFAGLLAALGAARRLFPERREAVAYLLSLVLPLLAFYTVLGLNDGGQPNWTAPAFVSGTILLAAVWVHWAERSRVARVMARTSLALAAVVVAGFFVLSNVRLRTEADPLGRVRGWPDLAAQVEAARAQHGAQIVMAGNYQIAALMTFYLPGRPFVFMPRAERIHNQYAFWPGLRERVEPGADAILLEKQDRYAPEVAEDFAEVIPLGRVESHWRGKVVRSFYLYRCVDYKGAPR